MNSKLMLLCALTVVGASYASASEEPKPFLRLLCEYSHTFNVENMANNDTSGEDLIAVYRFSTGAAAIDVQGELSRELFVGSVSEDVIRGESEMELENDPRKITETIAINRYTGKMKKTFGIDGKPALIHHASCKQTNERKF